LHYSFLSGNGNGACCGENRRLLPSPIAKSRGLVPKGGSSCAKSLALVLGVVVGILVITVISAGVGMETQPSVEAQHQACSPAYPDICIAPSPPDSERPYQATGWCKLHYERWWLHAILFTFVYIVRHESPPLKAAKET
jgi:hypothetical protein